MKGPLRLMPWGPEWLVRRCVVAAETATDRVEWVIFEYTPAGANSQ